MKFFTQLKIAVTLSAILLFAGCMTQNQNAKRTYFFYPVPPDEPRIQFLTGFSSERDLRGGQEKTLMMYLTGVRPSEKSFAKPYGAAAGNKKFYVCDTDLSAVLVVDLQTRRVRGLNDVGEGSLNLPLNLTVDANGDLYVADAGRNQVVIFDKSENYIAAIGKMNEMKPRDVAVSKDKIYVADFQTHNVRVFDKVTRKPLFDIPSAADKTNYVRTLVMPTNLALDSQGLLYVSDTGGFRIQVYDADGKFLRTVGEMGDSFGQFARLKGIAVDRENRLYATDAMSQMTQIFDDKGQLLTWLADPETSKQYKPLPSKVFVDYDDVDVFKKFAAPDFNVKFLIVVINQLGDHKVSVYGFGERK